MINKSIHWSNQMIQSALYVIELLITKYVPVSLSQTQGSTSKSVLKAGRYPTNCRTSNGRLGGYEDTRHGNQK